MLFYFFIQKEFSHEIHLKRQQVSESWILRGTRSPRKPASINILPGPPYKLTYKHLPSPSCPLTVHSSDMRDHSSVHAEQPEIMENHSHDTDDNEQHLQIH